MSDTIRKSAATTREMMDSHLKLIRVVVEDPNSKLLMSLTKYYDGVTKAFENVDSLCDQCKMSEQDIRSVYATLSYINKDEVLAEIRSTVDNWVTVNLDTDERLEVIHENNVNTLCFVSQYVCELVILEILLKLKRKLDELSKALGNKLTVQIEAPTGSKVMEKIWIHNKKNLKELTLIALELENRCYSLDKKLMPQIHLTGRVYSGPHRDQEILEHLDSPSEILEFVIENLKKFMKKEPFIL